MAIKKTLRELEEEEGGKVGGKELEPDYQGKLTGMVATATENIAKLNVEYAKYFSGAEKKPPVKAREVLEKLITEINKFKKHARTQGLQFKIDTVLNSYMSYKTAWDKKLADIEKTKR